MSVGDRGGGRDGALAREGDEELSGVGVEGEEVETAPDEGDAVRDGDGREAECRDLVLPADVERERVEGNHRGLGGRVARDQEALAVERTRPEDAPSEA